MSMMLCSRCAIAIDTDYNPEVFREGFDDECICDGCYDEAILSDAPEIIQRSIQTAAANAATIKRLQEQRDELLSALKAFCYADITGRIDFSEWYQVYGPVIEKCRAAITKVEAA